MYVFLADMVHTLAPSADHGARIVTVTTTPSYEGFFVLYQIS